MNTRLQTLNSYLEIYPELSYDWFHIDGDSYAIYTRYRAKFLYGRTQKSRVYVRVMKSRKAFGDTLVYNA